VEIAIRISLLVYKETSYVAWAEAWLSGKDRTRAANWAAVAAYGAANWAAYGAANWAANWAAEVGVSTESIIKIIHDVVGRE